jgi:crotonobetainyl-CoA:carnitine CoA-transferase CaiB-like acyl-CoA transferase
MIAMAMSGMLYLTGDADRPPLNISLPQSYLLAGADGAVGAMLAYYHRERTGKGQHVDVSLQQSSGWFLANAVPTWELAGTNLKRAGALRMMSASETGPAGTATFFSLCLAARQEPSNSVRSFNGWTMKAWETLS